MTGPALANPTVFTGSTIGPEMKLPVTLLLEVVVCATAAVARESSMRHLMFRDSLF
jgi:hypothetical protein